MPVALHLLYSQQEWIPDPQIPRSILCHFEMWEQKSNTFFQSLKDRGEKTFLEFMFRYGNEMRPIQKKICSLATSSWNFSAAHRRLSNFSEWLGTQYVQHTSVGSWKRVKLPPGRLALYWRGNLWLAATVEKQTEVVSVGSYCC